VLIIGAEHSLFGRAAQLFLQIERLPSFTAFSKHPCLRSRNQARAINAGARQPGPI
jgi:hypothetical protein